MSFDALSALNNYFFTFPGGLFYQLARSVGSKHSNCLEFLFFGAAKSVKIPFTEIALALACAVARIAVDWSKYLQQELPRV